MSLATKNMEPIPVGDGSGKFESVEPQYGSIKQVIRRFKVNGSSLNTSEKLESFAFDEYGTLDGESTAPEKYLRSVRDEEKFANCYLEKQEASKGQGDTKDVFVTKVYQEAYDYIVEVAQPVTSTDENGRDTTKRTYVILKTAPEASYAFDPQTELIADPDDANQSCISQQVTEGNAVLIIERNFLEVTATPEQVGKDKITWTESGLKQVEQTFIVAGDYDLSAKGTVGTTVGAGGDIDGLTLSTLAHSARSEVASTFVARWAEPGILSVQTPKVGGQQQVSVSVFEMSEAEVTAALAEVTASHELIDVSTRDYQGFQSINYTFQVEDFDTLDTTENGLSQLTRTQLSVSAFTRGDIGTDLYQTLFLAGEQIDNGNTIKKRTSRYSEAGILNRSEDLVGSQKAITLQTIGADPSTPGGYSLARKSEGRYQGFQTNDFTFLKDNVQLSESEDLVGSQNAKTQVWFNPTDAKTITNYLLAKTQTSDFSGIETTSYTFLKPSVLSRRIDTRDNGALIVETVEAFDETPIAATVGSVQISIQDSNVEGIPTKRYTFAKGNGQTRISTQPGSIVGTTEVTIVSNGTPITAGGVLMSSSDAERDGYVEYTRTTIEGTILGTKTTWTDVVDVTIPGTVELVTRAVTAGGLTGTIAVMKDTPQRRATVVATVTVEIATKPPTDTARAYDLGQISCSVDATQSSYSAGGTDVFETASGNTRFSGARHSASISARVIPRTGSYLINTGPVSGSFSYTGAWENTSDSPNTLLTNPLTSTTVNTLTGTGSTAATGYFTTGILQRKVRQVLTALNGDVYWEVVTWTV